MFPLDTPNLAKGVFVPDVRLEGTGEVQLCRAEDHHLEQAPRDMGQEPGDLWRPELAPSFEVVHVWGRHGICCCSYTCNQTRFFPRGTRRSTPS